MLYDLFICHATEDKDAFVRPLAKALRARNVSVWYDEFSLRVGDSIRRSIDSGLAQSRFGVVVFSRAFFEKQWPQYELDGLSELEATKAVTVILPVWFDIEKREILEFSPSLANRIAARSADGMDSVVERLLEVIHPQGSPLIEAWRSVVEWGKNPPTITDPYWLHVVAASNRVPAYGADVPEESAWGSWSFPLPANDGDAETWGSRLAWTALQLDWCNEAERRNICVVTHPDEVYEFVLGYPGLFETCCDYPDLTAEYAPQLTIPRFSGKLTKAFDLALDQSIKKVTRLAALSPTSSDEHVGSCEAEWSLRHPSFGGYKASTVAHAYFSGGMFGPSVSPWDHADHMFWLLSDRSKWLPTGHREMLTTGMIEWAVWLWHGPSRGDSWNSAGVLSDTLHSTPKYQQIAWNEAVLRDVRGRIELAIERLGLSDSVSELEQRFVESSFVPGWRDSELRRENANS